jgi:hypothetical protein
MGGDSYMDLHSIEGEFSVCKVGHYTADMLERPFSFLAVTDTEKSLICPTEVVPEGHSSAGGSLELLSDC